MKTNITINKSILQALRNQVDTTRRNAIDALLNNTATNEEKHIVAGIVKQYTIAAQNATVTRTSK